MKNMILRLLIVAGAIAATVHVFAAEIGKEKDPSTTSTMMVQEANIVKVAKSGTTYSSIQAAIDASNPTAENPVVILIYPGTYTEQVLITKSYISLVGVDRERCIIQRDHVETEALDYGDATINIHTAYSNILIKDLTIKNIGDGDGSNVTCAFLCYGQDVIVDNCYLGGNGGRDTCAILGSADVVLKNDTQIEQYKTGSNASHPIWVCNDANITMYDSIVKVSGTGSGIQLNTTGNCIFRNCYFIFANTSAGCIDAANVNTLEWWGCKTNGATLLSGTNYSTLVENFSDLANVTTENIEIDGTAEITGDATLHRSLIMDSDQGTAQATITQNTADANLDVLSVNANVSESATWGADVLAIKQEGIGVGATCNGNAIVYDLKEYGGTQQTRFKVDKDGDVYLYDSSGTQKLEMLTADGDVTAAGMFDGSGGYEVDGSAVVSGDGEHIMKVYSAGTKPAAGASHYGKVVVEQQSSAHDRLFICIRKWNGSGYEYAWADMPVMVE